MKVTNLTGQKVLFKHDGKSFLLKSRQLVAKAPEWMMTNAYALKLREQEKISFEVKKQPNTPKEKLMLHADGLGLVYGDGIKVAALEEMIKAKEKELEDAKK